MCRIDLCGQIGVWAQKIYESDFMKMRSLKTALGQFCPTREDNNCCAIIATMLAYPGGWPSFISWLELAWLALARAITHLL